MNIWPSDVTPPGCHPYAKRDEARKPEVVRLFGGIFSVYGVLKAWRQMQLVGFVPCPLDKFNRQFHSPAPDRLWLSDFTYVANCAGFVYVAFIIHAYARRTVGRRASRTAHAAFVRLEARPA